MANNIFDKAKKAAPAKAAKKDEKVRVTVAGKDFDQNLVTVANLTKQVKELEAELKLAKEVVNQAGKDQFVKLYESTKRNPESFILVSESGANTMYLPMDKYLKVDETRASELTEKWGEDIVKSTTVFSFDADLLNKYGDVIAQLIENCTEIEADDKDNLIVAETTIEIAKGAIDDAITTGKGQVADFIEDIKPIFAIKNPQVKK